MATDSAMATAPQNKHIIISENLFSMSITLRAILNVD